MSAADSAAAVEAVITAVDTTTGVRLATPLGVDVPRWWPWDARGGAVDLCPDRIEVRVVAAALPLPPLLDKTADALRTALVGTGWAHARLCVVVTELDSAAFESDEGVT
ncbi:hypothetical protein OG225_37960 [Nocardia sp. NBC_01377]|uniref:hypothetical protein n=1 Tax=Nocardia sp. NBC_01377 TaxID=2903595 RepID=UPI00324424CD